MTACCPPQEIPGVESHTLECVLRRPDHLTLAATNGRTTAPQDIRSQIQPTVTFTEETA